MQSGCSSPASAIKIAGFLRSVATSLNYQAITNNVSIPDRHSGLKLLVPPQLIIYSKITMPKAITIEPIDGKPGKPGQVYYPFVPIPLPYPALKLHF
jgi:hypothetical protein